MGWLLSAWSLRSNKSTSWTSRAWGHWNRCSPWFIKESEMCLGTTSNTLTSLWRWASVLMQLRYNNSSDTVIYGRKNTGGCKLCISITWHILNNYRTYRLLSIIQVKWHCFHFGLPTLLRYNTFCCNNIITSYKRMLSVKVIVYMTSLCVMDKFILN